MHVHRESFSLSNKSEVIPMAVTFNHTIVAAKDRHESARFFRELLELPEAPSWGPFVNVQLPDGVLIQFAEPPVEIQMQHYAFLVDDELFERAYGRLCEQGVEHWADPQMKRPGETNTEHGGRGVYFKDPAGHAMELITRPYL
ncbi:catechol 2,3-dioxygenase-like lactoylglutathione lyase family enzyme [Streptomyces cinereoruber]|nr:catechol 2,3-dioxygenase-like lactoylglutathione lyase family enzyme [Streptomyces cinereoruber]